MPTYEYECGDCGNVFERFEFMSDEPLKTCPRCGGNIRRLIGTGMGIIFKGSGFHATDHRTSMTRRETDSGASCGRDRPCCGRNTPCTRSPRRT